MHTRKKTKCIILSHRDDEWTELYNRSKEGIILHCKGVKPNAHHDWNMYLLVSLDDRMSNELHCK